MIFVTVGTHEQPFDRLLEFVDRLKGQGTIQEEVVMQTGFSDYEPQFCKWQRAFPFCEMQRLAGEARLLISHGGPASCAMFWNQGRIPIVVPRQKKFGEHVNDHQVIFCRRISEICGNVIVVEEINQLINTLEHYDELVAAMSPRQEKSSGFAGRFQKVVDELMGKKDSRPRVGILSMQRIANHGSVLQAYALKRMVEDLGGRVEFVDYHPGKCLIPAKSGICRKLDRAAEILCVKAPLRERIRCIWWKKRFARKNWPLLGLDGCRNYGLELDLLIIGSDEVFNCAQNNANVGFSPELFGEGHRAKRLVSFAASFGNTSLDKLHQHGKADQVAEWLNRFDAVSVRDANSCGIVETLTGNAPELHLDPTLACGFLKEFGRAEVRQRFLLLYGYTGRFSREECAAIRRYADERHLKVYCIGGVQHVCDRLIDCAALDVIAYFKAADCVVTDTFHGAAFAVLAYQRFAVFVREHGYGNVEKLSDLLARFRLEDREIRDVGELAIKLDECVDFSFCEKVIAREEARARDYLRIQMREAQYARR